MIKYFCDGCGAEVTPHDRRLHGLILQSFNAIVLDELILCQSCNELVREAIKELTPKRDKK